MDEYNKTFDWKSFLEQWRTLYEEMKPQIELRLRIDRRVQAAKDRIDDAVDRGCLKQEGRIREWEIKKDFARRMTLYADRYDVIMNRTNNIAYPGAYVRFTAGRDEDDLTIEPIITVRQRNY